MNDIIKQRLVGALILLALGVVFWPIIFVEPGERSAPESGGIPLPPAIDATPIAAPGQQGLRAPREWVPDDSVEPPMEDVELPTLSEEVAPLVVAAPGEPRTRTVAPEQPVLDSKGVPVAWILQVASVSSAAKADELRDRLLAMQEKAYVKKIEQGQKALYRVYIGPNFERAQLEKVQGAIDSSFGVRSMIVRYIP